MGSKELFEKSIRQNNITATDGSLAQEFIQYYAGVENLSKGSEKKYYYSLKAFLWKIKELNTTIPGLKEKDVLELINFVRSSDWSEDTRADYWDRFTRFYAWAADRAQEQGSQWDARAYKLLADPKHKKTYKIDKNKVQKKGILSREELLRLVDVEANLCYKAFFSTLYESGMRAGEALSLLIKDVEKEDNGSYVLHIRSSKTIRRPVPLYGTSANYLRKWLSQHPQKHDKNAPLWLNTEGGLLTNPAANKQLRYLLKIASIETDKVTLHSFRHSRATELAGKGLTEFELCRLFGWSIGSKMPATYIREGALDVKTALRRAAGLSVDEKQALPVGVRCLQCEHRNATEAEYCDNCNLPLDPERLRAIKDNSKAEQQKELAKKYALELRQSIIQEVLAELRSENVPVSPNKEVIRS